jgi:tyrosine-protein kinase Etk/Wzc
VQVEEKSGGLSGLTDFSEMLGSESAAATEIQLMKSRSVMGETVDSLHLDIEVEPNRVPIFGSFFARHSSYDTDGLAIPWWDSSYAWGGEELVVTTFDVPDSEYGVEFIFKITDRNSWTLYSKEGVKILEGGVGEKAVSGGYSLFVQSMKARLGTSFTLVKKSRLSKIIQLQQQVDASVNGKDTGIITLAYTHPDPEKAKSILDHIADTYVRRNVERNSAEAAKSLQFLRERLPDVRKDLEESEAKLNEYQVEAESVNVSAEAKALLDQIVDLEKGISTLQMQKAQISRKFTPSHPSFKAWEAQMAELTARKKELDERVSKLPATQQKVVRLTRDVKVGNEIYLEMLSNIQELDIVRAGTVGNVRVVDDAAVNIAAPISPKKGLVVVISLLLAAMLSASFVLLRAILNRGIESPDQIEALGIPVYATIPLSQAQGALVHSRRKEKVSSKATSLLAITNPEDLAVEALRGLRTSLHFAMMGAKNNVLMISGPSPAVGKSFISVNFAAVVAQTGKKVLVVDADLRRGAMHEQFNLEKEGGLSDLLSGQIKIESAIKDTDIDGLQFISRGMAPPNPSELLMAESFGFFIDEIKNKYDLIIVDTPPILAVTDAAIVGSHAGTSMIVTRYGVNPEKEVELTKTRFSQNGVEIKGAVLNAVQRKARTVASYGYYAYEYKSQA